MLVFYYDFGREFRVKCVPVWISVLSAFTAVDPHKGVTEGVLTSNLIGILKPDHLRADIKPACNRRYISSIVLPLQRNKHPAWHWTSRGEQVIGKGKCNILYKSHYCCRETWNNCNIQMSWFRIHRGFNLRYCYYYYYYYLWLKHVNVILLSVMEHHSVAFCFYIRQPSLNKFIIEVVNSKWTAYSYKQGRPKTWGGGGHRWNVFEVNKE